MTLQLPDMYVIAVVEDGAIVHYFNQGSDGVAWYENIKNADIFTDREKAVIIFENLVTKSTLSSVSSDGTKYPHVDIHRALRISNTRPNIKAALVLIQLTGSVNAATSIQGEIKKPTGYTYDES